MESQGWTVETYGRHHLLTLMVVALWPCAVLACTEAYHATGSEESRGPHDAVE